MQMSANTYIREISNMNRICNWCNIEKNLTEYSTDKRLRDGKRYTCKDCVNKRAALRTLTDQNYALRKRINSKNHAKKYPEQIKQRYKNWYENVQTEEKYSERIKINNYRQLKNKEKNLPIINEYKSKGCYVCGYNKCTRALEFHHIDPTQKYKEIGNMLYHNTTEQLVEELKKCVVLCANCHKEHHSRQI